MWSGLWLNRGIFGFGALLLWTACAWAESGALPAPIAGHTQWEPSIAEFATADRHLTPPPGGVVFVGSSSIRLWKNLETQFRDAQVIIKRGFGGARMSDCTRYLERLVTPYKPRLVLVYAGDNDLAEDRQPRDVLNHFVRFVEGIRKRLPLTRIAYISIKPSPARASLIPKIRKTNDLILQFVTAGENLDFIDVFTPMLNSAGHPRAELFKADALHLNSAGYTLWRSIIAPHVH